MILADMGFLGSFLNPAFYSDANFVPQVAAIQHLIWLGGVLK